MIVVGTIGISDEVTQTAINQVAMEVVGGMIVTEGETGIVIEEEAGVTVSIAT